MQILSWSCPSLNESSAKEGEMWLLILRVVGVFALAAVFVGFGAVEVIVEACLLLLRHF